MQKTNSVYGIVFIEADDASSNLDDWNIGSALFATRKVAKKYASAMANEDSLYVYDVIRLDVFDDLT